MGNTPGVCVISVTLSSVGEGEGRHSVTAEWGEWAGTACLVDTATEINHIRVPAYVVATPTGSNDDNVGIGMKVWVVEDMMRVVVNKA